MSEPKPTRLEHEIAFEAYGVRASVAASTAELLLRARPFLPPGWRPCSPDEIGRRFELIAESAGTYEVARDDQSVVRGLELDVALAILDSQVRIHLGRKAPDAIFVHAGVVARGGRAIVMPGMSFAGKTTLVHELVRAGAVYYSDEFAVIDQDGRVHPYAKALSLRDGNRVTQTDHAVERLGGTAGEDPLPIGLVAVTSFRPGASWQPRRLTAGEGALAMLANTVPAMERPAEVMPALARAVEGAVALESARGEAEEIAPLLLAELTQAD